MLITARIFTPMLVVFAIVFAASTGTAHSKKRDFVALNSNSGITVQGTLTQPDGAGLQDPFASFLVEIWGDSALRGDGQAGPDSCKLFSETHSNVRIGKGQFSFRVNGDKSMATFAAGNDKAFFPRLFVNPPRDLSVGDSLGFAIPALECLSGQTQFLPNLATNSRSIRLKASLSNGKVIDLEDMQLQSAPFAMQAAEISGYSAEELIKVGPIPLHGEKIISQNEASRWMNLFNDLTDLFSFQNQKVLNIQDPQTDDSAGLATVSYVNSQVSNFSFASLVQGTANQIKSSPVGNAAVISLEPINPGTASFGMANKVPVFSVDAFGRLSNIVPTPIGINANQITVGTLPMLRGGTGIFTVTPQRVMMSNAAANALQPEICTLNGQILQFDGLKWICVDGGTPGSNGTVTSVAGVAGQISIAANPTLNPTIGLAPSGVTTGTYAKVQVLANGRVSVGSSLVAADVPSLQGDVIGFLNATSIGANKVTYAKMQKVSADKVLLGNYQGANSNVSEITVGDGLDIDLAGKITSVGSNAWFYGGNTSTPAQVLGTTNATSLNIIGNGNLAASIDVNGQVGIGTSAPRASLDMGAAIIGKPANLNAISTVDFGSGNVQYANSGCGSFNLHNMKPGGSYSFTVFGSIPRVCNFRVYSDAGVTQISVSYPPDHSATLLNTATLYNFKIINNRVFIAWSTGL